MISSIAPRLSAPPQTAPAPAPPPPPAQDPASPADGFKRVAGQVVGAALGFGFGAAGFVVNACAGGAEGALRAARVADDKDLAFNGMLALNLGVSGALTGGPVGAVWQLAKGALIWNMQGEAVRQNVRQTADKWVDRALEKIPGGNPENPTPLRRIGNGLLGEVVGGVAGGFAGATGLFAAGNAYGHDLVERVAESLRK